MKPYRWFTDQVLSRSKNRRLENHKSRLCDNNHGSSHVSRCSPMFSRRLPSSVQLLDGGHLKWVEYRILSVSAVKKRTIIISYRNRVNKKKKTLAEEIGATDDS